MIPDTDRNIGIVLEGTIIVDSDQSCTDGCLIERIEIQRLVFIPSQMPILGSIVALFGGYIHVRGSHETRTVTVRVGAYS